MERIYTLNYQGKAILFCNYEGLRGNELLATLKTATQQTLAAQNEELLILANFTDTYTNKEVMDYLTGPESKAATRNTKKIAVVGITGLKKMFFNVYNTVSQTKAYAFETLEAAKDYLVA